MECLTCFFLKVACHEEGRLLNTIMSDVDNKVTALRCAVDKIILGESGRPDVERMAFIDHAFTLLGGYKWYFDLVDKETKHVTGVFPHCSRGYAQKWSPRSSNQLNGFVDSFFLCDWPSCL